MIRKVKGGFRVVSPKKHKNMGTYKSKAAAEKREKQIKFFSGLSKVVKSAKRAGWSANAEPQRSRKRKAARR